ncbi:histidine-rich glycoprotein [Drosophila ficusphila]|uniref:histidine-rich glycoprotein n=1 Tax=Drosophila ficusphila TaxID=30025 RepID=UPI0007E869B6|nr:histidine-rich glycoprotein [Drosophila ficusphila]
MLKAIIVFATILVAVAVAMQPLEDNDRNHHLNHKRQLSHHHQQLQDANKERIQHRKSLHQAISHHKEHKSHGHATSARRQLEESHKKGHHQKEHHQDNHFRKARSHSKTNKHHHKRHTGSRRH